MFEELRAAFEKFEAAYKLRREDDADKEQKGEDADKAATDKAAAEAASKALAETINALEAIGYSKRELIYILDIESLTYDRWNGKASMKPDTFRVFQRVVNDILDGKSQQPIIVSDTGFVSWQYVFTNRQPKAKRIWYITEGRFLLNRSPKVRQAVSDLFFTSLQEQQKRELPVIVYLYPSGGLTEDSLRQWEESVRESGEDKLFRGTVIGIAIKNKDSLPWFQPGIRSIILEMEGASLEGYLRVKLALPFQGNMLKTFDIAENSQHIQWISVEQETVTEWRDKCIASYGKRVEEITKQQTKDFQVHTLDLD